MYGSVRRAAGSRRPQKSRRKKVAHLYATFSSNWAPKDRQRFRESWAGLFTHRAQTEPQLAQLWGKGGRKNERSRLQLLDWGPFRFSG
jgi:hypothetical protein